MSFHFPKIDLYGFIKKRLDIHLPDVRNAVAQELITELRAMPTAAMYGEARAFGLTAVNTALDTATQKYPVAKVLVPFLKPLLQSAVTQVVSAEHLDNITNALTEKLIGLVAPTDAKSVIAQRNASDALAKATQEGTAHV